MAAAVPSDPNPTVYTSTAVSSLNGITGDIYGTVAHVIYINYLKINYQ